MRQITYEQFLRLEPCWLKTEWGRKRLDRYAKLLRGKATALDILRLPLVRPEDKLWAVLHKELTSEETLHEFACRCAERALTYALPYDTRSAAAIEAKREWLCGEIGTEHLRLARWAALDAAKQCTYSEHGPHRHAALAAWEAAWTAAEDAAKAASSRNVKAAGAFVTDSHKQEARRKAERKWQIKELKKMLREEAATP